MTLKIKPGLGCTVHTPHVNYTLEFRKIKRLILQVNVSLAILQRPLYVLVMLCLTFCLFYYLSIVLFIFSNISTIFQHLLFLKLEFSWPKGFGDHSAIMWVMILSPQGGHMLPFLAQQQNYHFASIYSNLRGRNKNILFNIKTINVLVAKVHSNFQHMFLLCACVFF